MIANYMLSAVIQIYKGFFPQIRLAWIWDVKRVGTAMVSIDQGRPGYEGKAQVWVIVHPASSYRVMQSIDTAPIHVRYASNRVRS